MTHSSEAKETVTYNKYIFDQVEQYVSDKVPFDNDERSVAMKQEIVVAYLNHLEEALRYERLLDKSGHVNRFIREQPEVFSMIYRSVLNNLIRAVHDPVLLFEVLSTLVKAPFTAGGQIIEYIHILENVKPPLYTYNFPPEPIAVPND
jgi:hypothetical protein